MTKINSTEKEHLDTPKKRRDVYEQFCRFVEDGESPKDFVNEDHGLIVWDSLRYYLRRYPESMPINKFKSVMARASRRFKNESKSQMNSPKSKIAIQIWSKFAEKFMFTPSSRKSSGARAESDLVLILSLILKNLEMDSTRAERALTQEELVDVDDYVDQINRHF